MKFLLVAGLVVAVLAQDFQQSRPVRPGQRFDRFSKKRFPGARKSVDYNGDWQQNDFNPGFPGFQPSAPQNDFHPEDSLSGFDMPMQFPGPDRQPQESGPRGFGPGPQNQKPYGPPMPDFGPQQHPTNFEMNRPFPPPPEFGNNQMSGPSFSPSGPYGAPSMNQPSMGTQGPMPSLMGPQGPMSSPMGPMGPMSPPMGPMGPQGPSMRPMPPMNSPESMPRRHPSPFGSGRFGNRFNRRGPREFGPAGQNQEMEQYFNRGQNYGPGPNGPAPMMDRPTFGGNNQGPMPHMPMRPFGRRGPGRNRYNSINNAPNARPMPTPMQSQGPAFERSERNVNQFPPQKPMNQRRFFNQDDQMPEATEENLPEPAPQGPAPQGPRPSVVEPGFVYGRPSPSVVEPGFRFRPQIRRFRMTSSNDMDNFRRLFFGLHTMSGMRMRRIGGEPGYGIRMHKSRRGERRGERRGGDMERMEKKDFSGEEDENKSPESQRPEPKKESNKPSFKAFMKKEYKKENQKPLVTPPAEPTAEDVDDLTTDANDDASMENLMRGSIIIIERPVNVEKILGSLTNA